MTPQERREKLANRLAIAYAETIKGPANGWGQHVHPSFGRSDFIMHRLSLLVGQDECQRLITEAMKPQ